MAAAALLLSACLFSIKKYFSSYYSSLFDVHFSLFMA